MRILAECGNTGGPRRAKHEFLLVSVLLTIGLLLRLDFMRATAFTIDGDEAIVGLMGKHILEGRDIPVFYYGQHYMGSLEAIMASISFWFFGMSSCTLQLVPLVWSLALIPIMYLLGTACFGHRAGVVSALLTAVPPPALVVWSSKARGGFIEVVVLGALALLITVHWLRAQPSRLWFPAAIGFVLGVGWWVNNQIAYFMVPVGIVSLGHILGPRESEPSLSKRLVAIPSIVAVGAGMFFIGSIPYWVYSARHGFPSAGMFGFATYEQFREHLGGLRQIALPMVIGAKRFWHKQQVFPGAVLFGYLLYGLPLAIVAVARIREEFGVWIGRIDRRHPVELFSLFCISCCLIFAVSSYGWLVQAPRYLLPLYVGIFVLLGVAAEYLLRISRLAGYGFVAFIVVFHLAGAYYGGRAVAGEPMVFAGQRVARDHGPLIEALDQLGITKVRTNYWIGYRLAFETAERVTFVMLAEPDQIRIPEYQDSGSTPHELLPLVLVQSEAKIIKPAMARVGISFSELKAGEYQILFNLTRSAPEPSSLPASVIVSADGFGGNSARSALDGSLQTRWGTGAPQSPGQSFRVQLRPGTVINGLGYRFGTWLRDIPKSMSVDALLVDGTSVTLLSPLEYKGVRYLAWGAGGFTIRFDPVAAQALILRQLGKDPVLDWSIAELVLFGRQEEEQNE